MEDFGYTSVKTLATEDARLGQGRKRFRPSVNLRLGLWQLKHGNLERSCACQTFGRPSVVGSATEELKETWG